MRILFLISFILGISACGLACETLRLLGRGGRIPIVSATSFSEDGSMALVPYGNGQIGLLEWIKLTGNQTYPLGRGQNYLTATAISNCQNGCRTIAVGKDNGKILVYDARGNVKMVDDYPVVIPQHDGVIRQLFFSPSGRYLYSVHGNRVDRWDVKAGEHAGAMQDTSLPIIRNSTGTPIVRSHEDAIEFTTLSNDGSHLLTVAKNKTATLWDFQTGINRHLRGIDSLPSAAALSGMDLKGSDSDFAAIGSWNGKIQIWNRNGKLHQTIETGREQVKDLNFTPSADRLLAVTRDGKIRAYNPDTGKLRTTFGSSEVSKATTVRVYTRFGTDYAVSGHEDGKIRIWLISKDVHGRNSEKEPLHIIDAKTEEIEKLEVSKNGKIFVANESGVNVFENPISRN